MHRTVRLLATTALSLSLIELATSGAASAANIQIDTTAGTITVDFLFAGNLSIGASDVVTGSGANAAQLIVGNNLDIAPGARIDFSGVGKTPGAGGGGGGGLGGTGAGKNNGDGDSHYGYGGGGSGGSRGADDAGGTVAIIGSVVKASGGTVNTLGGQTDFNNPSSNGGRVVIGSDAHPGAPQVAGDTPQNLSLFTDTVTYVERDLVCFPSCHNTVVTIGTFSAATQDEADAQAAAGLQAFRNIPLIGLFVDFSTVQTTKTSTPVGQGFLVGGQNHILVNAGGDGRSTVTNIGGPTNLNPFVIDAGTKTAFATPYIPSLAGGAEAYGLLDGVLSTDPFFASAIASATPGAKAELYRVHLGPAGYDSDFTGFDAVFLLNLTNDALLDPSLGVVENGSDDGFLQALLQGGFAEDPLFGGGGPLELASLPGFGVYEILVPELGTEFNVGGGGVTSTGITIENNQVLALGSDSVVDAGDPPPPASVPEPASLSLFAGALAAFGLLRRRRRRG